MDAAQALSQALLVIEHGHAPQGWRVIYIGTGQLAGRIVGGVVGLLFSVGAIVMVSWIISLFITIGVANNICGILVAALFLLAFAALGIYAAAHGISGIALLRRPKEQRPVLILAPEGVVERSGLWGTRVRAVTYADIASARLHVVTSSSTTRGRTYTSVSYELIFTRKDGRQETWDLDGSFGSPDGLASQIIAAQAEYAALHSQSRF